MDGSSGLFGVYHLKGKNQVCYNSILSRLSLDILSFGFLGYFARNGGISLFSLEAWMLSV
jgi:hypothetical protein